MWHSYIYKLLLCFGILLGSTSLAHSQEKTEYEVKALYLVSLLKYISFPDKGQVFKVGVIGDNPFKGHLKKYNGAPLKGRKVKIQFFGNNLNLAAQANCHFLFIADSEILKQKAHIKMLNKPNNVILGDNKLFMKSGGVINFQFLGNKVRWETNKKLMDLKKIKVDFQVYKLSTNKGQVK